MRDKNQRRVRGATLLAAARLTGTQSVEVRPRCSEDVEGSAMLGVRQAERVTPAELR